MDWISTHEGDAVARLPDYLKQPRIDAFVRVLARHFQTMEDALRSLQEGWWLVNAEGVQLDGLGELLVEPRGVLSDVEYKLRLQARIRLLRGSATPDELLGLLLLLNPTLRPRIVEEFPAALELHVTGGALPLVDVHLELLQSARAGGVRLNLRYQYTTDADTFRLAGRYTFLSTGTAVAGVALTVLDVTPFQTGAEVLVVVDEGTPRQQFRLVTSITVAGAGPAGALNLDDALSLAVDAGAVVRLLDSTLDTGGGFDNTAPGLLTTLASELVAGTDGAVATGNPGFVVGQVVVFEPGTSRQEAKTLVDVTGANLVVQGTMHFTHPAGSVVAEAVFALLPSGQLSSVR